MIRLLKLVFKVVPGILKAYFSWIVKYSKHKERYPIGLRFYKVQQLVRFVILKMGPEYHGFTFNLSLTESVHLEMSFLQIIF